MIAELFIVSYLFLLLFPGSGLIFDSEFFRIEGWIFAFFLLFLIIFKKCDGFWCEKCNRNDVCPCHQAIADIAHRPYCIRIYNGSHE